MTKKIAIAGGTGMLGRQVVRYLLDDNHQVVALVRDSTDAADREDLRRSGCEVRQVDFASVESIAKALDGCDTCVSTLSGLRDIIVEVQKRLFEAAKSAGVKKFMPSDFAIDFRQVEMGRNRNLNLRREFLEVMQDVGSGSMKVTSVLNGAFMDMLDGTAPYLVHPIRRAVYYGDPDQPLDFTTVADTARFTASAAADDDSPRWLMIAGDTKTPRQLAEVATRAMGKNYRTLRAGGITQLRFWISVLKTITPDRGTTYPVWQGMQYFENMLRGAGKFDHVDNDRYDMPWTDVGNFLRTTVASQRTGAEHGSATDSTTKREQRHAA